MRDFETRLQGKKVAVCGWQRQARGAYSVQAEGQGLDVRILKNV
jgi:S-adenosylhomocysteine hydrolase